MPVQKPLIAGGQLTVRADLRRIEVDNVESPNRT